MNPLPPGHGYISGVTGSGKTTTALGLMAQAHTCGVTTFAVDAKGDLSAGLYALQQAGVLGGRLRLWDVDGRLGARFRLELKPRADVSSAVTEILTGSVGAPSVHILAGSGLLKDGALYCDVMLDTLKQLAVGARGTGRPILAVIEEAHLLFLAGSGTKAGTFARTLVEAHAAGVRVLAIAPDPGGLTSQVDAQFAFMIQHASGHGRRGSKRRSSDGFLPVAFGRSAKPFVRWQSAKLLFSATPMCRRGGAPHRRLQSFAKL